MRQAIITRYVGPGNVRGSRIIAKAFAGKVTIGYDHGLSITDNHAAAAKALAGKFGWHGAWVAGSDPSGNGNVYVDIGDEAVLISSGIEVAFTLEAVARD